MPPHTRAGDAGGEPLGLYPPVGTGYRVLLHAGTTTSKDSSQSGLGNEQKHRLAITVACRAVFHAALVGLFLSGGNGVPSGSSCLGRGGEVLNGGTW